jgi:hypothetical protein
VFVGGNKRPLFEDENFVPRLGEFGGNYSAPRSRADYNHVYALLKVAFVQAALSD